MSQPASQSDPELQTRHLAQTRIEGGEGVAKYLDSNLWCTPWCKFLEQEVRENSRTFCCATARVSPLPPPTSES